MNNGWIFCLVGGILLGVAVCITNDSIQVMRAIDWLHTGIPGGIGAACFIAGLVIE